jgi:hypothetical protein
LLRQSQEIDLGLKRASMVQTGASFIHSHTTKTAQDLADLRALLGRGAILILTEWYSKPDRQRTFSALVPVQKTHPRRKYPSGANMLGQIGQRL